MHFGAIGLGTLRCVDGALAHCASTREPAGMFGLTAFLLPRAGLFLARP